MSLRSRVVTAVAAIALALCIVLVFVTRSTQANLVDQIDKQLSNAVGPVRNVDLEPPSGTDAGSPQLDRPPRGPALSSLFVGTFRDDELSTVVTPGLREADVPPPAVTAAQAAAAAKTGETITVQSSDGDVRWRIRATPMGDDTSTLIIGLPLDTVDAAISDLVALEFAGAIVIFLALALVAVWVIRLGVQPVNEMTRVATAIAGGDLSHRVPESDPNTEAGQLGDALNKMLTSIEASFAERHRVEERLRQFVADASHELRTPVSTIRGYAELYRSGALRDRDDLGDAMRRTEQEAIRMGGLVDDLLSLARLGEGQPLDWHTVDLSVVADDAVSDARAVDPGRSINSRTPGPVVVRGDAAKIRQIVANLVGNALVHTTPTTSITVASGIGTDGTPYIEVADDGPGMEPEVADRVFERFYRADPSRSRHRGGSGLGLAIVEATVARHGGRVDLRSSPGDGTVVRIDLPRTSAPG